MLKIRLARVGRKNQPHFRLIVSEDSFDTKGRYLEVLGAFDPRRKKETLNLKEDRIKYWLSRGAQPSPSVNNLLVDAKIVVGSKLRATHIKKKKEEGAVKKKGKGEKPAAEEPKKPQAEQKPEGAKEQEGEEKNKSKTEKPAPQAPQKPQAEDKSDKPAKE